METQRERPRSPSRYPPCSCRDLPGHNSARQANRSFLPSGFVYDSAEQAEATFEGTVSHYQYSRFGNPTVTALETKLASIEGVEACRVTATGMAAVHATLLCHLRTGDRLVASRALFGSCYWIVSTLLPRYGIEVEFVDGCDLRAWREALLQPTAMVLLESPSNPMLEIVDLRSVCGLAHAAGALVVVDKRVRDTSAPATGSARRRHRRLFLYEAHRWSRPSSGRRHPWMLVLD